MKKYSILTLFPQMFPGPLGWGVTGRGLEQGLFSIDAIDIRDYTQDKHRSVDDAPYGGGEGMVMKPEPIIRAIRATRNSMPENVPVISMTPQGERFDQKMASELAALPGFIILCGRYEGIDERACQHVDRKISLGDFILSGGELAAFVILDAVLRLLPGVLGNPQSLDEESFRRPLLEYPQYTRPPSFEGADVPEVLLSGHHAAIKQWRLEQSLKRTLQSRPDLLEKAQLTKEEQKILDNLKKRQLKSPSS